MANNKHFYGFRWVRNMYGAPDQPPIIEMPIVSGLQPQGAGAVSVDLRIGDPVKQLSTGGIDLAAAGDALIFGVIVGFTPVWDGTKMVPRSKWPGATSYGSGLTPIERQTRARIVLAPGQVFEIDCDDATTATTQQAYLALVGENCDHILPTDVTDSSNPKADPFLDISTHGTATAQWRILGLSSRMENADFSGLNVKLLVTANELTVAPFGVVTGPTGI
jgi:hypothetical protein